MAKTAQHIAQLIYSRLNGTITDTGEVELSAWLDERERSPLFGIDLDDDALLVQWIRDYETDQEINRKQVILEQIRAQLNNDRPVRFSAAPVHRVHFLRTKWFRYAATIIILFGIGAYLWNNYTKAPESTPTTVKPSSHDILPGGQKATLTLADGKVIILDNAANGKLAIQNGNEIIKRDGQIIYSGPLSSSETLKEREGNSSVNASKAEVGYNTMSTPRGGQYQLTLSDGSRVWLNAASKIIYPTRFVGSTREVKIEGEVYFEVKASARQPFVVKTNSDDIKVLGTEFNINNYVDEPASKITLITGAVKVNDKLLQPGQAYAGGKIKMTNTEQDVAWRKGVFNFDGLTLEQVMRQLSRWYDVEIVYKGKVPSIRPGGSMGRDLSLIQVLDVLKAMEVKYTLEGRKLIIE